MPARLVGAATVISVTFDDGWADNVTAASLLRDYGMRGTFYVNTNTVGTSAHLSWAQLAAMEADGHEIGGHALDHVDLTGVDAREAHRQILDDRARLTARGFAASSFAYPFGAFNSTVEHIVRDSGYASARGAFGLRKIGYASARSALRLRSITARRDSRPYALPMPPPNPFAIVTPCCITADTPLSALQNYIKRAEDAGGGWVPLTLHRICDDCGGDAPAPSMSPATFERLLAWLEPRASRGTVVRTVADVIAATAAS
jgi:peptidoglycan/xylan/chitin deacetylase (PgdA/CDA1 family)